MKRRFKPGLVKYHEWVQFADSHGAGYCEPEAFVEFKDFIFLIECKLAGRAEAKLQLEGLYAPVLAHIKSKPVRCLLVCKHVTDSTPGPFVKDVEEFLLGDLAFATWHWLPEP